jgi:oxygen-independent coproporphyrinogen-3 oxidase
METMMLGASRSGGQIPGLRDDGAYVFHHPPKFSWQRDLDPTSQSWGRYSVYLHVPFCRRICTFCTFERKQLRRGSIERFVGYLDREMTIAQRLDDFSSANVHSVYLGGGTASLLTPEMIDHFLVRLRAEFGLRSAEITLECEPGTKKAEDFGRIRDSGVNRISIGVQAFQEHHLANLNRSHRVHHSLEMIEAARSAGFENIHIDLMYGLPGQTAEEWAETIEGAIGCGVQHISAYRLIVFPRELLARSIDHGELARPPAADVIEDMRRHVNERLSAVGYRRYSLTEFALPGFECDYVRTSWDGSNYLGFGAGAYSRNGDQLWENDVVHAGYEGRIEQGRRPAGKSRTMTPSERLTRDIAMGLCLLQVDLVELRRTSGAALGSAHEAAIDWCRSTELIRRDGDVLSLTDAGQRYATEVMKSFTEGSRGRSEGVPAGVNSAL